MKPVRGTTPAIVGLLALSGVIKLLQPVNGISAKMYRRDHRPKFYSRWNILAAQSNTI
jgi:hypothetical protein